MNITQKIRYKPRDIARLGLIKNSTNSDNETANYQFIIHMIKTGKLKAKNYGSGARAYWLVQMDEIERFNQEINN
jgi:hypothetical protein